VTDKVDFRASFPAIQSAIKIDGQGGARIQLDIPESEVGNFIGAMMWRGQVLLVTIEPDKQGGADGGKVPTGAKRQSRRATA